MQIFRCLPCRQQIKHIFQKEADSVSIIVMNPSDGAVMAMVDYPGFHLNEPFQLIEEYKEYEGTKRKAGIL